MKKLIALLIAMALTVSCAATLASCGNGTSNTTTSESESKESVPGLPEPGPGEENPPVFDDYYEYGWDDVAYAKGTVDYKKAENVYGKTEVGELTVQGWNGEVHPIQTSHMAVGSEYLTVPEARAGVAARGIKYVAVEFAVSEGATIGFYNAVPMTSENFVAELAGAIFTDGSALGHNANLIEDYFGRFRVYSEGKELEYGTSIIEDGVWYTIVIELALDTNETLFGADSYISVGITNGNSKPIYIAGTRYYTNDTFKTDYATEDDGKEDEGDGKEDEGPVQLEDYYEFGADEFVDTKTTEVYTAEAGEINGKTGVYNFTGNGWSSEINAINTTHIGSNAIFADAEAVRANFATKGYKYIAMEFCLSEGAEIRVLGSSVAGTLGLKFADGVALAYAGALDAATQTGYFTVYANGAEVEIGDTIENGVWYTVVVELLLDETGNADGENCYSSVGFGVGNNKAVYIAGGRYYTNDSYTTDYITEEA